MLMQTIFKFVNYAPTNIEDYIPISSVLVLKKVAVLKF